VGHDAGIRFEGPAEPENGRAGEEERPGTGENSQLKGIGKVSLGGAPFEWPDQDGVILRVLSARAHRVYVAAGFVTDLSGSGRHDLSGRLTGFGCE